MTLHERIDVLLSLARRPVIEGWATPEKAKDMADLVVREKPSLIVEIGVFGGRSLIPQAMALQENTEGLIVGIDPWTHECAQEAAEDPIDADWWATQDLDAIANGCWRAIEEEGVAAHAVLLRAASQVVAPLFQPESIDILEIDGNHNSLVSTRDVLLYWPLVRPGGHVWFDDCDWPQTQKAIALMDARATRVHQTGNCILFTK